MIVVASLRKELLEQLRTSRLLVLGAILLVFGLLSPLLAKYTPEMLRLIPGGEAFAGLVPKPTLLDAVAQYVKNVNQFGILLAILLSMGAVVQEKERGTAAMMLVKPLPRAVFLLAKFVALSLAFLFAMILSGLGAYYYTAVLFITPDLAAWAALTGLIWIQLCVYIAFTLFFSTLVRSQAAAGGMGLAVILLFSLIGALPTLGIYLPAQLVTWGASLFTQQPITAWPALWVSLGLILACLAAASMVFEKQEL